MNKMKTFNIQLSLKKSYSDSYQSGIFIMRDSINLFS